MLNSPTILEFVKNSKFIQEIPGTRYGRLVVISRGENIRSKTMTQATWLCQCDCGKQVVVRGHQLRAGKTRSCGCARTDWIRANHMLPSGLSGCHRAVATMKYNAKKRGIAWNLTDEYIEKLMIQDCHYCGRKPMSISKGRNGSFTYNGIDRVDNNKGYTEDNVVPCCIICNESKRSKSVDIFLDMVQRIYKHMNLGEV